MKKNFTFLGVINDSDSTNKNYKILYKASLLDKTNLEYIIEIYEDEMNEENIENYLNNRMNKRSILKSVLTEYNEIINVSDEIIYNKKDYKKYFSKIKFF